VGRRRQKAVGAAGDHQNIGGAAEHQARLWGSMWGNTLCGRFRTRRWWPSAKRPRAGRRVRSGGAASHTISCPARRGDRAMPGTRCGAARGGGKVHGLGLLGVHYRAPYTTAPAQGWQANWPRPWASRGADNRGWQSASCGPRTRPLLGRRAGTLRRASGPQGSPCKRSSPPGRRGSAGPLGSHLPQAHHRGSCCSCGHSARPPLEGAGQQQHSPTAPCHAAAQAGVGLGMAPLHRDEPGGSGPRRHGAEHPDAPIPKPAVRSLQQT
jgi:hypothetical protein